jgi:IPT/TIG domain
MSERGLIIYEEEDEIREEMNSIGLDGDNAELTPGPQGGFILTGEDAEALANHKGMVTTDLGDLGISAEGEAPTLTSISPDIAVLGDPDVTMVCTGTGFTEDSTIMFAGNPEPIVFTSETEISTVVKPSLDWGATAVDVMVRNSAGESETLQFTFTDPVARGGKGSKRR